MTARAEQEKKEFSFKNKLTNISAAGFLTIGGMGAMVGGAVDLFVNAMPANQRHLENIEKSIDERYPLVDVQALQTAEDDISKFQTEVHDLVIIGQESEIPELVKNNNLKSDYEIIDQNNAALTARQNPSLEFSDRTWADFAIFLSGFTAGMGGIYIAGKKSNHTSRKQELPSSSV